MNLATWSARHSILSAILGINTPHFAILNVIRTGVESGADILGAGTYLSAAVSAAVGAVASFTNDPPQEGSGGNSRQRRGRRRAAERFRERVRVTLDGKEIKPSVPENPKVYPGTADKFPNLMDNDTRGGDIRQKKPPPSSATRWVKIKFRLGLVLEGVAKVLGGGGIPGGTWSPSIFINPQIYCEMDPSLPWCPRRTQIF